mmetsp:Transcript_32115/g.31434  ORF Transcript_32115/g.31434 Transcript_32115/m.31434 type:complete len:145 (-) Transcript_32115:316-750(-)
MKLDFYISKNNSAIHLGESSVFLREIIDRETALSELSSKTQLIEHTVRIMPAGKANSDKPIGNFRFKMRLRKPISEIMRFYRDKNEINTLNANQAYVDQDVGSRRKIISMQVLSCTELKVRYGDVAKIAPFFYYQFYSFDEKYS